MVSLDVFFFLFFIIGQTLFDRLNMRALGLALKKPLVSQSFLQP